MVVVLEFTSLPAIQDTGPIPGVLGQQVVGVGATAVASIIVKPTLSQPTRQRGCPRSPRRWRWNLDNRECYTHN